MWGPPPRTVPRLGCVTGAGGGSSGSKSARTSSGPWTPGMSKAEGGRVAKAKSEGSASEEDNECLIALLCQKFSGLIDRVQEVEVRQADAQQRADVLRSHLQEVIGQRRAAAPAMEVAANAERAKMERMRRKLQEVQKEAGGAHRELQLAQEEVTTLTERCAALDLRYEEEQKSAVIAADQASHVDEAATSREQDCARLRAEVQKMDAWLATTEEELLVSSERSLHHRADMRVLEERLAEAVRSRQIAERRAEVQQEDICGARQQVNLYRERLDAARQSLLCREEELNVEKAELAALQGENTQREQEAAKLARVIKRLGEVKVAIEAALRENVGSHGRLKAVRQQQKENEEAATSLAAKRLDLDHASACAAERVIEAKEELSRLQENLHTLQEAVHETRNRRDVLEQQRNPLAEVGNHLHADLQCAFVENERLRAERDEATAGAEDIRRRLRAAEPTLETARQRARELEESLQEVGKEASRANVRKEKLLREVGQCREKMCGLRKRHSSLTQKVQALKKRLLRSSSSYGGSANFAAVAASAASAVAAAEVLVAGPGSRLATVSSTTPSHPRARAPRPTAPDVAQALAPDLAPTALHIQSPPEEPECPPTQMQLTPGSPAVSPAVPAAPAALAAPPAVPVVPAALAAPPVSLAAVATAAVEATEAGQESACPSAGPSPGSASGSSRVPTPTAGTVGLDYLRQWIELEEARLGVARTPPRPSSPPSAARPRRGATASSPASPAAQNPSTEGATVPRPGGEEAVAGGARPEADSMLALRAIRLLAPGGGQGSRGGSPSSPGADGGSVHGGAGAERSGPPAAGAQQDPPL